ncbi:MAG: transporter substrate-binding domain-containing protein, partial [Coriobacteriales bacterium]|nr:transporter substrate-binding domain-containing protein [Coriobacteriales bacterium]
MSGFSKRKMIVVLCACFALVGALALAGCSGGQDASKTASGENVADVTVNPGTLTIATGNPAWPPYVMNDAPESGEGFEAAVAYAVAEKMGFSKDQVVWVRTGFDEAITPGAKDWDMNIQQFSVTEERKAAVDFSSPYFTPSQSIVVDAAPGHDKYANATSLAELGDAVLGAEAGSTSYTWGMDKVNKNIQVFNSNADAAAAFNAGQIDGLILDTPTAVY